MTDGLCQYKSDAIKAAAVIPRLVISALFSADGMCHHVAVGASLLICATRLLTNTLTGLFE
jgi:hypothetical protein